MMGAKEDGCVDKTSDFNKGDSWSCPVYDRQSTLYYLKARPRPIPNLNLVFIIVTSGDPLTLMKTENHNLSLILTKP